MSAKTNGSWRLTARLPMEHDEQTVGERYFIAGLLRCFRHMSRSFRWDNLVTDGDAT